MARTLIDPPSGGDARPTVIDDPHQGAAPGPAPFDPTQGARATVIDGPAGGPAGGAPLGPKPGPSRGARIGCAVAAIGLTLGAIVGGLLWFYFGVVNYEPVARRHIPGNANVAIRVDAADVALSAPVRKHLWPLVDINVGGKTRKSRLTSATGVSFADVRELVVASTDATSWVVLLGGKIKPGGVVPGVEKVAREESWPGWRRDADLMIGPGGVTIGQAEDGTILIGTDTPIVRASLIASDDWQRIGLPESGTMTFVVTREAWDGVGGELGGLLTNGGRGLFRRAGRTVGSFTLDEAPKIAMRVSPVSGETAATLTEDLKTIVAGLKLVMLLMPDRMGEKRALQSTVITAATDAAEVNTVWPADGLDQAFQRLATTLRSFSSP
ncbi:hypothetical protein [Chondromyces crocatus]|uniref:Uncharacterized protein n=1 Tax=Chondromyces crocatus TaxID=52 RepID=A0A0K1EPU9_CHOCO|nr:hypothetical protein [Chondromyces crocatus]AKT42672.1 uncharacterized protein CMC5_068990 [Chondromyces crocatus]